MKDPYQLLMEYALRLVSKKRYTVKQMREKLEKRVKKKELEVVGEIEKVMARLKELKYLDDEQYVEDYIAESMKYRTKGVRALKVKLYKRGIAREKIDNYLKNNEVNEFEAAKSAFEKKVKKLKNEEDEWKKKQKLFRHLASRGFAIDTIYKVLDCCYNHDVR